jgi:microcystin-dependent protein
VRGEGNVEKLSLPDLQGALPAEQFQVPAEQVAGKYDGHTKQFKVSIRVKDRSVTQIPPLSFSWFNPEREQYQTTQSSPIALQVTEAQVVSAADVVSAVPQAAIRSAATAFEGSSEGTGPGGSATEAFVSANLAIVRDPVRLLAATPVWASPRTLSWILYGAAVAAFGIGLVLRRAGQVEPILVQRRQRLKVLHSDVSKAGQLPPREAADLAARALREVIAQYHLPHRDAAEALVAQSERVIFSTGPIERPNVDDLIRQALQHIDEAKEWL